jgi:type VI secretion system protein ImpL
LGESLGKAKEALKEKAKSGGIIGPGSACSLAFSGRYPFVRGSSKDVPLADFVKYFASNGLLDQFFQQNLKAVVDTSSLPWRQKKADGQSVTVSQEAIRQFQSAARIRDSYFPAGGQNPDVQFDLKLISMSPGLDNVRISNEGQELVYKNGQSQAARVRWPGPTPGTGVQFIFETPDKKQVTSPRKTGPWALFRMLDESSLERSGGAELFRVSFQSSMYFADFEIQALSMNNPFSLGEFRNFHCPGTL